MKFDLNDLGDVKLDRLEPLWKHHNIESQANTPHLAPFVPHITAWKRVLRQYKAAFVNGSAFGWIVTSGGRDVGFMVCAMRPMQWSATFQLPSSLWEIVTLFVHPEYRLLGVGSMLLSAMEKRVSESGVPTKLAGIIAGNGPATQFMTNRGFKQTWVTMTRFDRPRTNKRSPRIHGIRPAKVELVSSLDGLWFELHHHHQAVSPALGPFVGDAPSWSVIKGLLRKSAKEGLLLVARDGERIVGLASAAIHDARNELWLTDKWETRRWIGETKFLVVLPEYRGKNIGAALLAGVDTILDDRGIVDQVIGAIAPNSSAIRFYEARGFRPAWVEYLKS